MEIQRSDAKTTAFIFLLAIVGLAKTDEMCRDLVRYITYSEGITFKISPNIVSEWTSSRCEVRPGPKFLTRHIKIFNNSTWEGRFYIYSDSYCHRPRFTLLLRGSYRLKGSTTVLKGATAALFNFTRIELHPQNKKAKDAILKISSRSCPNTVSLLRNASNGKSIYLVKDKAFSKRSCRNEFGISEYEFSLLKLERYRKKGSWRDKLYFAEISTLSKTKRKYQPTSYQMPLLRSNAPNCTICSDITRSSPQNPLQFPLEKRRNVMLEDTWGSTTCETQPYETFLTRYMKFHYASRSWEGNFYYFLDPHCKKLNFMIYGKGKFTLEGNSAKVHGGQNYQLTLYEAKMTPYDSATTQLLNTVRNNECGKYNSWEQGVEQSITESKGCSIFGIKLPRTEYELLMMDRNEQGQRQLYIGQKASDGAFASSANLRATSYQIPLTECSSFDIELKTPLPDPTKAPTKYLGPVFPIYTPSSKRGKATERRKDDPSKGTIGQEGQGIVIFKLNSSVRLSCSPVIIVLLILLLKC